MDLLTESHEFEQKLKGLFPDVVITSEEVLLWLSRLEPYPLDQCMRAIEEHRIEARNRRRPDVGEVLAKVKLLARGTGETRPSPSHGTLLAQAKQVRNADAPSGKAEAVLRHYRGEWFTYSRNLNDRMHGHQDGDDRTAALARRQSDGFRTRCRVGAVSCLVEDGVAYDAACAWADAIFWEAGDFASALADLRANGIAVAEPRRVSESLPFVPIFRTPPEAHDAKSEQLDRLAEAMAIEHAQAPVAAEIERAAAVPAFQDLEL